jgi:hypothetical protein
MWTASEPPPRWRRRSSFLSVAGAQCSAPAISLTQSGVVSDLQGHGLTPSSYAGRAQCYEYLRNSDVPKVPQGLNRLLRNSRDRPAISFLSFRRRTWRRNLRYRRALCTGRVWTTYAAVNEQDSSAVRRRNDNTGVCGFIAGEVVGVAERFSKLFGRAARQAKSVAA